MKRHNPDLVSLVFGLVFVMLAALWPLWQLSLLDNDSITWVPATALIAIGLLGLTLSIARSRAPASEPAADFDEMPYVSEPADTSLSRYDHSATEDEPTTVDPAYDLADESDRPR